MVTCVSENWDWIFVPRRIYQLRGSQENGADDGGYPHGCSWRMSRMI